ncbi:AMP-forming adenylation domain superfamily protein, putative D-alanine:D-alanyl carrier protein ligase [Campylobacter pinnipediorum subsp. caledonicus]|nr:AMP-forming adenylation domain superfamily protein, putative D-alanine:D-alanyl carrier protein ligase [Campylobacter pinnipediorum subsp. caledonicus]
MLSQQAGSYFNTDQPIVIYMEKSIKCLAIMFGSVYAGGFYSIIDTSLPKQRALRMQNALNAHVVICDNDNYEKAIEIFGNNMVVKADDILNTSINYKKLKAVRESHTDLKPLYCNFTSGSTGEPKGVLVSHSNIIDFIPTFAKELGLRSDNIFANQSPFDFDIGVKDVYCAIFLGSTVVLIPKKYFTNTVELVNLLYGANVNTFIWAVGALVFLSTMKALSHKKLEIKKIIYGGEVMPKLHLNRLKKYLPDCTFINAYGPAEITCNCTYHIIQESDFEKDDIPIGKPFKNRNVFLLHKNKVINIPYKIGEICVSGKCVAIGYLNNNLNKSFIQNPTNSKYYERIYKTGDLGFWDEKGELHYKGRIDFQIKRFGHRIELMEIETEVLNLGLDIERACVVWKNNNLILFFEGSTNNIEITQKLKSKLPTHMLPNIIYKEDKLPINKNGKIDRVKLNKKICDGNKGKI